MNNLGQRCQTVGRATGVGDDVFPGVVGVVHTHDIHRCGVLGRSAHDNAACTGLDVGAGLVIREKKIQCSPAHSRYRRLPNESDLDPAPQ